MGYRPDFGCMIAMATCYLILWVGVQVKLSDEDIVDFWVLRDVAWQPLLGLKLL